MSGDSTSIKKFSEVSEYVKNLLKTHKISKKVLAGRTDRPTDRQTDRVTEKAKFGQKNLAKCSEVSENVKNLLKTHKISKKVNMVGSYWRRWRCPSLSVWGSYQYWR